MASKKEIVAFAVGITKHHLWQDFVAGMSRQYFSAWSAAKSVEDREEIYAEQMAFKRMVGKLGVLSKELGGEQENKQ